MSLCFFASDLHGAVERYEELFRAIAAERPAAVFLGGDLLPTGLLAASVEPHQGDFIESFLGGRLEALRARLGAAYPRIFAILGNDDPRVHEPAALHLALDGLWEYAHDRTVGWARFRIYGYAHVPPTPFLLKDWERYDISRHVDTGCSSPEEGWRSVPRPPGEIRYATIAGDLLALTRDDPLDAAICLFHAPPYRTALDRAALDGRTVDHVPLDVHVGSIAIRRFIESRQPLLTLHGHVHESARLTGCWRDRLGRTHMLSAAHDGPELALVRFDPECLDGATRELI
jgi:Icc-related predicted phosphoesterase